ncbi:MAG TPA: fibronectin type III domain-containing protein, partial [Rhodothermales bacterium]|nr:fibronectin type III domain-containing protein [Rhodothermales bacterium]
MNTFGFTILVGMVVAGMSSGVLGQAVPAPPVNFSVRTGDKTAIIRWESGDRTTLGYYVYWSTNPTGPFTSRTSVMQTQPYWVDTSLPNDRTYYFAISAVNTSFTEGEKSQPIAVTPKEL